MLSTLFKLPCHGKCNCFVEITLTNDLSQQEVTCQGKFRFARVNSE